LATLKNINVRTVLRIGNSDALVIFIHFSKILLRPFIEPTYHLANPDQTFEQNGTKFSNKNCLKRGT